jgi:dTDP-4-amino-4,6-dideoxygalactose transaminase
LTQKTPQKGENRRWEVPLADVVVDDELAHAVDATLRSGWWSAGPRVEAFELAFREYSGARFALAVSNGTTALQLALAAAGIGPGDEVIVPSLNFVAAANAISHTGATPVFCDILGDGDLNLDLQSVDSALTSRTAAVLALHYGGYPCDMSALSVFAERHGLAVIEDSAHAPGGRIGGRSCGTLGLAGCFSFFSNKNLAVGEGGMLVTDDEALYKRARLLRSHGMTTLTWDRHRGHASSYDVELRGFNFRLDEIHAAIGLVQLGRLDDENRARGEVVARYRRDLQGSALSVPFGNVPDDVTPAYHLAVVVCETQAARERVRAVSGERRVQTSLHYPPIHLFTAYRGDELRVPLDRTEDVATRLVTIPLFGHMRPEQVELVVEALLEAAAG